MKELAMPMSPYFVKNFLGGFYAQWLYGLNFTYLISGPTKKFTQIEAESNKLSDGHYRNTDFEFREKTKLDGRKVVKLKCSVTDTMGNKTTATIPMQGHRLTVIWGTENKLLHIWARDDVCCVSKAKTRLRVRISEGCPKDYMAWLFASWASQNDINFIVLLSTSVD